MARTFASASTESLYNDTNLGGLPLSFSCWFYGASWAVDQSLIFVGDQTTSAVYFLLFVNNGGPNLSARCEDAVAQGDALGGAPATNAWQHGGGVFASTTSRTAYLNGTPGTEETTSVADITPTRVSIGVLDETTPADYMDGQIADAAIWNAALTDAEMAALAAGASPLSIRPGNLIFYVPLVRDNDIDIVGGLPLTATGTPTVSDDPGKLYRNPGQSFRPVAGALPPLSINIAPDNFDVWAQGVKIVG
jgi:hypothetical protein